MNFEERAYYMQKTITEVKETSYQQIHYFSTAEIAQVQIIG